MRKGSAEEHMRAMVIGDFGGPEQLRPMALPRPRPGEGEVLVRVVAAGVNPVDCLIRSGKLRDHIPHRFPLVLGWDLAGVVEELGAGCRRFRKADRVFGCARKSSAEHGTYAELVVVAESALAPMPAKLLFEEAASVPLAAHAASQCLSGGSGLAEGQTVLIHAAAGGVGHFAVQLAKLCGARVIGTGSGSSQSLILGFGADVGIDYTKEDFRDAVRRHCPEGVDLVLDLVGGETLARSYEIVRRGGRLVSLAAEPSATAAAGRGIVAHSQYVEPGGEELERIAQSFDRQRLRTHVQRIYPLAKAGDAHRALEDGHVKGKLVLNL
jgi:NADPH:quinone reductase-like Zn-dependent oxidoreductase